MSKARLYGMQSTYVPNVKADARYKKKFHEKGKAFADSDEERRQLRQYKAIKAYKSRKGQATQ